MPILRIIMAEKRKSVFKRPSRRRRNRSSTPVPDLLSPYLPGAELFISSPLSAVQTRPVHSSAAVVSSPRGAFISPIGHGPYSGSNPTLSFDSNQIFPNFSVFRTESGVVQDLSSRSTAQSAFPPQIDWYGPSGSSFSYIDSTQSNPTISTSSNPQYGVQRFFEDNSDCLVTHWTVSLESFLMLLQTQPFPVVMSKQNFVMLLPGY